MEEAAELANYLPLSFKMPKEQKFIGFFFRLLLACEAMARGHPVPVRRLADALL